MTIRSSFDPFPFAGIDSYRVLVVIEAEADRGSVELNRASRRGLLRSLQNMQFDGHVSAVWNVCRCGGAGTASLAYAVLVESLNTIPRLETLARIYGHDSVLLIHRSGSVFDTPITGVVRYVGKTTVNDEQLGEAKWNNVGEQDTMPWLYYVFAGVPGFLSFSKSP